MLRIFASSAVALERVTATRNGLSSRAAAFAVTSGCRALGGRRAIFPGSALFSSVSPALPDNSSLGKSRRPFGAPKSSADDSSVTAEGVGWNDLGVTDELREGLKSASLCKSFKFAPRFQAGWHCTALPSTTELLKLTQQHNTHHTITGAFPIPPSLASQCLQPPSSGWLFRRSSPRARWLSPPQRAPGKHSRTFSP